MGQSNLAEWHAGFYYPELKLVTFGKLGKVVAYPLRTDFVTKLFSLFVAKLPFHDMLQPAWWQSIRFIGKQERDKLLMCKVGHLPSCTDVEAVDDDAKEAREATHLSKADLHNDTGI